MKALLLALIVVASAACPTRAAVAPNLSDGVALGGYDAVSYFEGGKPSPGSKDFSLKADGATYLFASQKHLEIFKAKPSKYEPAYGGWCAYAMSKGELVEVNPQRFKILNGQLLLFYDAYWNNTLKKWNLDETELFPKAEASWKKLNEEKK
jgi:YHS domain-containing protein